MIVRRWEGPIQRLCTRMTGDEHRGEDLAQETFSRLFARRKDYRAEGRLSTFLWRMALNLCYDELRRRQRRHESPLTLEDDPSAASLSQFAADDAPPDEHLAQREQADLVRQAVLRLAEGYRSVIMLRHFENLKFREIAEVLDIPEGTVKSRMSEGLAQLNRILTRTLNTKEPVLWKTPKKTTEPSLIL